MPVTADKDARRPHCDRTDQPNRCLATGTAQLRASRFSRSIYGDPAAETDDLLQSIRDHGILVPLVVARWTEQEAWEVISGHRRLACAIALGLARVPCEVRTFSMRHITSIGGLGI